MTSKPRSDPSTKTMTARQISKWNSRLRKAEKANNLVPEAAGDARKSFSPAHGSAALRAYLGRTIREARRELSYYIMVKATHCDAHYRGYISALVKLGRSPLARKEVPPNRVLDEQGKVSPL